MKRRTAKEILAESFRELSEKKPVDKITVIDIVEHCGYSTTTFYRHFTDKYDLMAWEYAGKIEEIMKRFGTDGYDWSQICLDSAMLFYTERDYLKNLLQHTIGLDSFSNNMKRIHFETVKKWLQNEYGEDILNSKMEMYLQAYCRGAVDLSCDWILGKYEMSPEEMGKVYEGCMPYPLYRYFEEDK